MKMYNDYNNGQSGFTPNQQPDQNPPQGYQAPPPSQYGQQPQYPPQQYTNYQQPYQQYQQPYQQQRYYAPMPPMPGKGAATASMICGIISLVMCLTGWMALIGLGLGIPAIITGASAKKQGYVGGMAQAGFIMGIIGTVLSGLFLLACTAILVEVGTENSQGYTGMVQNYLTGFFINN